MLKANSAECRQPTPLNEEEINRRATDNKKIRLCKKCNCEVLGSTCKPCRKIYLDNYNKKYYQENKEKIIKNVAEYKLKNIEKVKKQFVEYRKNNREKLNKKFIDWKKKNPLKIKKIQSRYYYKNNRKILERVKEARKINASSQLRAVQNYRARKRNATGQLSKGLSERLFILQKGKCACCGEKLKKSYHLDHIMPLALGGSNSDENIQLLNPLCNIRKNAKHPIDYMQSKGLLL